MISATRIFKTLGQGATLMAALLFSTSSRADINIVGNVYGGGNEGDLTGHTEVVLRGGTIEGDVYGGARKADVGSYAFVNIDGQHAGDDILVRTVYGGNDISGSIGNVGDGTMPFVPSAKTAKADAPEWTTTAAIDKTWNAFVLSTSAGTAEGAPSVFVGSLFGGGNGDYDYASTEYSGLSAPTIAKTYLQIEGGTFAYVYGGGNEATVTGSTDIYINNPDAPTTAVSVADAKRMGVQSTAYTVDGTSGTDMAVFPQTIDRVFGGNNLAPMDIQPNWYLIAGRANNVYSGGNKGAMTCKDGILVYVFQNEGGTTTDPVTGEITVNEHGNKMQINNIYGGCRMADVQPASDDFSAVSKGFSRFGYNFPAGYAARVYISGGNINNVYGGNDVSGDVYAGTDVEINGAISGDVYGGGNGSYAYTDNPYLAIGDPDEWADYYYDADGGIDTSNPAESAEASLEALNKKRPHVENTLVHIFGEGEWRAPDQTYSWRYHAYDGYDFTNLTADGKPTMKEKWETHTSKQGDGEMTDHNRVYVTGGVYCGGNSASLVSLSGTPTATLQIGQCVTMDEVFLGSNGAHMIEEDLLHQYAEGKDGIADLDLTNNSTAARRADYEAGGGTGTYQFVQFDLRNKDHFDAYMSGVDVNILPNITYDNPDNNNDVSTVESADRDEAGLNFSTHVGSFFCGGNVGSMTAPGTFDLALPREMVIYNKVVGGCNAANVAKGTYNAFHMGGLTNNTGLTAAKDKNGNQIDASDPGLKLKLYVPCRMQPMKLVYTRDENTGFVTLDDIPEHWNTDYVLSDHGIESDVIAPVTVLVGGNIYGGCYTSGYVNGSVQIDIKDELCSTPQMREWFGDVPFVEEGITDDNNKSDNNGTAIVVDNMRRYVLNHGWSAFGGGYGLETEIWGNTYMNMERNAGYINAYGGGDQGFIGKMVRDGDGKYVTTAKSIYVQQYATDGTATTVSQDMPVVYEVTTPYNTYVNLRHDIHRSLLSIFGLNAIYGGGYKGVVTGNTNLYAGGGLHYDVFGGACNADVYGSTQLIVGQDLEGQFSNNLTLRHCAYGGNDFGGQVYGTRTHDVTLPTTDTDGETGASATRTITSNTYVQYLGGTIESGLYGGSCGLYRYDGTYPGVEVSEGNYQNGDFYHIGDRIYPDDSYQTMPTLKQYYDDANTYNTFVDINNGAAASNYIVGNIYGGGYGFCDETGRVDASKSLVVLRGQSYGNGFIANQAFGGGYFSNVDHSTLEAVSGRFRNIYGGTYGTTVDEYVAQTIKAQAIDAATLVKNAEELAVAEGELTEEQQALIEGRFADLLEVDLTKLTEADYTSKTTHVNVYSTMDDYTDMDVYGAGAFTGAGNTWVNLFGGEVRDIYGGSDREGVSGFTHVSVPLNSTISVNTIYGGSHGSYEALPCDVQTSNIDFLGSDAVVRSGNVFGGNNAYRATRITNVNYNAKARANDNGYLSIFGAGNGDKSVAAATNVTLGADAIARKVYGGGYAGDVFNQYDVTTGTVTDASGNHTIDATEYQLFSGVDNAHKHYCHWDLTKQADDALHEVWTDVDPDESITNIMPHHTWIKIDEGAKVMYSVYGAGYGPTSVVAGHTLVENYGTIVNDIFGGGEQGNIRRMHFGDSGYLAGLHEGIGIGSAETVSATINLLGGDVRNVFGGGYEGYVGDRFAYNPDGTEQATYKAPDAEGNVLLNTFTADLTATTNINMGKDIVYGGEANTHYNGHPSVALSLYGAGDRGAVYGDSYINIFDGHVGYDYNAADGTYTEHLKYNAADNQNIMKEDGNVYGGGFGEAAHVRSTHVNLYDGTIRNSLYGGGEMAAVGWGDVKLNTTTNELDLWYIDHLGSTEVNMYGGQVNADVFGGGRGYSYDNYGVMQVASSKYFTDGFVFGTTSVDIHGGTVGTDETIKEENGGHGNVFGGGNIGYVYGGNKKDTDGYYYHADASDDYITRSYTGSHQILSEDVRVDVRAYGRAEAPVTIPYTVKYSAGQRVAKDVYERCTNDALKAKVDEFLVAKEDIAFAFDGVFHAGDYIPNEALNTLTNNDSRWTSIDDEGIVIRNAVFAGGNVSKGSDRVYAFAHTIFGNATASLVDVYARDLIEVGEEGLGGLYGDGNLTYVDGYRELNVSNYGTDFFALQGQLDLSNSSHLALYNGLTSRQKAFYTTKYLCTAVDGDFPMGSVLMNEDYERLLAEGSINAGNWKQSEAMINEGRYLNTLQRADYAGIKGSRLVLKGAMDRAQGMSGEVDFTDYTINRVGELSLNRNYLLDASGNQITETIKITDASGNLVDATLKEHGSYFGIYNVVKYLGGVMSDYDWFAGLSGQPSVREAQTAFQGAVSKDYRRLYGGDGLTPYEDDALAYGQPGASFFNWKVDNMDKPERNNGTVANKIALASGVFLELVKEPADEATATEKEYGPVIGVVELDLLNVAVGEGGGYVYAKNIHGQPSFVQADAYAAILSDGNQGLKTSAGYHYGENDPAPDGLKEVVTSGNFIHPSLTVVDDCFPMEKNLGEKAHYWYIKGSIYVYDQLISAYTGNAGTYSSTLDIPLTMNNKYNTSLQLVNILPGLYTDPTGLYNDDGTAKTYDVVFSGNATQSFKPNQPISFWQWHNIPSTDAKNHFTLDTYRCNRKVQVGETGATGTEVYQAGQALLPDDYTALETACTGGTKIYALDDEGNIVTSIDADGNETPETLEFDKVFHVTNGLNHDNDFLLTYDLSNPNIWNDYYSKKTTEGIDKMTTNEWTKAGSPADYLKSATFTATASGVYGQKDYSVDDIISNSAYAEQTSTIINNVGSVQQAAFEPTYIVKKACKVTYKDASDNTVTEELNVGFGVSESFKNGILTIDGVSGADKSTVFEPAYVCLSTFQLENKEYRFRDQIIGATEYATYASDEAIQNHFQPAWSCVTEGKWGGQYFENGQLYKGVDVAAVSKEERAYFTYNYDALDLLIADYIQSNNNPASTILTNDPASEQNNSLAPYDATGKLLYSKKVALDVTATYKPADTASTFTFVEGGESTTIGDGSTLTGEQFSLLPNDRRHYAHFAVSAEDASKIKYIPVNSFSVGSDIITAGVPIGKSVYDGVPEGLRMNIAVVDATHWPEGDYYICLEEYVVGENNGHVSETAYQSSAIYDQANNSYAVGATVPQKAVITQQMMIDNMPNLQNEFTISGVPPVAEATLYVPIDADIEDYMEDRYVTAIYDYQYQEKLNEFDYVTNHEKHVVNILVKFLSPKVNIGRLREPDLKLPTEVLAIQTPAVDVGAFEVLTAGWELYSNEANAESHRNGRAFKASTDSLFWYMDGNYLAYYAETNMGRTYSDPVRVSVANYHRLDDVLANVNRLGIDYKDAKRAPRIYITDDMRDFDMKTVDADGTTINSTRVATPLDAMAKLYTLTMGDFGDKEKNHGLDIRACQNLEFFLQSDIDMKGETWTPLGANAVGTDETNCAAFSGNLHGNGHTILDLDESLFDHFCGYVVNLGVTSDSYYGPLIAKGGSGHVENCWVASNAERPADDARTYPFIGKDDWVCPEHHTATNHASDLQGHIVNCYYLDDEAYAKTTSEADATQDGYYLPYSSFTTGADHSTTGGFRTAFPRSKADFINGNVAYALNRFYLEARQAQYDGFMKGVTGAGEVMCNVLYRFPAGANGSDNGGAIAGTKTTGEGTSSALIIPGEEKADDVKPTIYKLIYPQVEAWFGGADRSHGTLGYVEALYHDGDFRFADGLKPVEDDIRMVNANEWLPIYPDDYIFFGQKLTYGLYDDVEHDMYPTAAAKHHTTITGANVVSDKNGLLIASDDYANSNRLFRTPAYYGNGTFGQSVVFNYDAAFTAAAGIEVTNSHKIDGDNNQIAGSEATTVRIVKAGTAADTDVTPDGGNNVSTSTVTPMDVQKGLTAIDFTGYQPSTDATQWSYGFCSKGHFYHPLSDFAGLSVEKMHDYRTDGLTQNLLVYVPDASGNYNLMKTKILDLDYTETNADYRTVNVVTITESSNVNGHLVKGTPSGLMKYTYSADRDQFLVDKQDFNCPISYTFEATDQPIMWYQRTPSKFANADTGIDGWSTIVLPFTATVVTTNTKGEITHFYGSSTVGHEYWLRKYEGAGTESVGGDKVTSAVFNRPAEDTEGVTNELTNDFLWDWYYSKEASKDKNTDIYHQEYYHAETEHGVVNSYENYPFLTAGVPYIVAFPGKRYYEFDMSGTWTPSNTFGSVAISSPGKQTVTYASSPEVTIAVSDAELKNGAAKASGYTYAGAYAGIAAADAPTHYAINAEGTAFDQKENGATTAEAYEPFRAYFTGSYSASNAPRRLVIGNHEPDPENEPMADVLTRGLTIYGQKGAIVIESTLNYDATVIITTTGGQMLQRIVVPAETRQVVPVDHRGIFIANHQKVAVM